MGLGQDGSCGMRPSRRVTCACLLAVASITLGPAPGVSRAQVPPAPWVVAREEGGILTLATSALRVRIEPSPWRLSVLTLEGRGIAAEVPPEPGASGMRVGSLGFLLSGRQGPRWWRVGRILTVGRDGNRFHFRTATDDPEGRILEIALTFPSAHSVALEVRPHPAARVLEVAEGLASPADEEFFGLGARYTSTSARGMEVVSRVHPRMDALDASGNHLPVAFFLSSYGYGVLVDSPQTSVFQLNTVRPDAAIVKVWAPELRLVLLHGPEPLAVLREHAALVGRPSLPPMWAFGVWKTALGGETGLWREVASLRREGIPVSALWSYDMLDEVRNLGWRRWIYAPGSPGAYGDLRTLADSLRGLGFRLLGYLSPEVRTASPLFSSGSRRGYFVRNRNGDPYLLTGMQGDPVALVDFTNPAAVTWWQGLVRSILTDLGFDGWMQDGGDGAPEDGIYASPPVPGTARNRYPGLYARATHAAARGVRSDFVTFVRSGFGGTQGDTLLAWQCDQRFSWSPRDGLPTAIRAAINGSLSGFPFWAPDIGGYAGCGHDEPAVEELWIRWVQVGALQPVMRDHLGEKCRGAPDLWSSPRTTELFRRYARLHQSLVPYIYSYARVAAETGAPIMRHSFLSAPHDRRSWTRDLEYTLGDSLLVAPVVEPGARTREVYFPPGTWIDWWDGSVIEGPAERDVPAPLDRIPLFVRAGAILPLFDPALPSLADGESGPPDRSLILQLFPAPSGAAGSAATFTLYDGTHFRAVRLAHETRIEVTSAPVARTYEVHVPGSAPPLAVTVTTGEPRARFIGDGERDLPPVGWYFDDARARIIARLRLRNGTIAIRHARAIAATP